VPTLDLNSVLLKMFVEEDVKTNFALVFGINNRLVVHVLCSILINLEPNKLVTGFTLSNDNYSGHVYSFNKNIQREIK
jgi:hypothetical protein